MQNLPLRESGHPYKLSSINSGIEVHVNYLIIRPVEQVREGWEKAFIEMAEKGDDILLDDINTTEWDENEWQW